ncbi:hypothetical protein PG994_004531 [Apiospora phragmitis]|uniref:Helicase C-terminal domain-containing protein n=1 Tax=Apiospora phragmitis TaxID=2905665 RepID=A0ABR1VR45_9PEZI
MELFESSKDSRVLLMSTGVGAFGLNLTAADQVFILEPQWNPAVEKQAIGRVQRLEQRKDVVVTRYLILESIEMDAKADLSPKSIHSQQSHKESLAQEGRQMP